MVQIRKACSNYSKACESTYLLFSNTGILQNQYPVLIVEIVAHDFLHNHTANEDIIW